MVIVLINWRILRDQESAFLERWQKELKPRRIKGLIGEFLSRVRDRRYCDRITWELDPGVSDDRSKWKSTNYVSFVNVGMWETLEDFLNGIGPMMSPPGHMDACEAAPRRRAILTCEAWRRGRKQLPMSSSEGVIA